MNPDAESCGDRPRAAFLTERAFRVGALAPLKLGSRQLRVRPLAAGVCGTDLSARAHPHEFLDSLSRFGATNFLFDPDKPLVLGHEFGSEIVEVGEAVTGYQVGERIFTLPVVTSHGVVKTVGHDNVYPGGLSQEAVIDD